MAATEKSFKSINGVPVYYRRGGNTRPTFKSTHSFHRLLESWMRDLKTVSRNAGYGNVRYIDSAGAYVNKPKAHGRGEAIDLDKVVWTTGRTSRPINQHHASRLRYMRRRYLAVDAITRKHFRFVLDGWYNAAHRDHIHMDTAGGSVRLVKSSSSDTKFIQAVCNNFAGTRLVIDGKWGRKTQAALSKLLARPAFRGINPLRSQWQYRRFLAVVADHGFKNKTP